MKPLDGKVALVTGAAGVMGCAAARFLLDDGCKVAMVDVNAAANDARAGELGTGAAPFSFDIGDPAAVRAGHARVVAALGPVDILVNNAGILSNNKVEATSDDEWRRVLAANLDGAFYLARAIVPDMKRRRWGRIINTCSLAAKTGGLTAGTAYSTSKGALTTLTFSLARELAAFGITVNGISPAYVNTPMVTEQLTEAQRQALRAQVPVGRFCEPEEFAHVVRFLAHPLAGFITGEIVDVNGGLHMD
jgi:3-oxoacyl-[acyl-carrier protein] reductase